MKISEKVIVRKFENFKVLIISLYVKSDNGILLETKLKQKECCMDRHEDRHNMTNFFLMDNPYTS